MGCAPPTHVTAVTSHALPCSVAACQPRRLMSRCLTCRTRTLATLLSGSLTTSSHQCVTSHLRDSRWQLFSLATQPPSRSSGSVYLSSSLVCSVARHSFTGARADPADVRRQEHDVRRRPTSRPLPHMLCPVPWPHVNQGGQRAEQELQLLCRVDSKQH